MATKSLTETAQTLSPMMRKYCKAHNLVILAMIEESYSHEVIGVAIKTCTRINGTVYYTFGRLYHIFGEQFSYEQCGCVTFRDEMRVRKAAYKHFGIK